MNYPFFCTVKITSYAYSTVIQCLAVAASREAAADAVYDFYAAIHPSDAIIEVTALPTLVCDTLSGVAKEAPFTVE
jgi:hypothetical protein